MTTAKFHGTNDRLARRVSSPSRSTGVALALLVVGAPFVGAPLARAHEDGIAVEDCSGCHGGGKVADVTITPSSGVIALGQTVRFTVSIRPATAVAGLFFRSEPAVGQLALVSGESTKLSGSGGVTHVLPKRSTGTSVSFAVDWRVPTQPGDAQFYASAVAGNDDRRSSGDATGEASLSLVFGCSGNTYFADYDLDGVGSAEKTRVACSRPPSFADVAGDCDDYDGKVHPGASELCNGRDDDCDAQLDEGLSVQQYCADTDGDGHGVMGATTMMGCGPSQGYGLCDNDCNERDVAVYPGAPERCNYLDDNCNQRVDEGARSECGVGWCRRNSEGCNAQLCVPGKPSRETCNALDDDCDGVVDDGSDLCPSDEVCMEGACARAGAVDAGRSQPTDAGRLGLDAGAPADVESAASSQPDGCGLPARGEHASSWLSLSLLGLAVRRWRRRDAAHPHTPA